MHIVYPGQYSRPGAFGALVLEARTAPRLLLPLPRWVPPELLRSVFSIDPAAHAALVVEEVFALPDPQQIGDRLLFHLRADPDALTGLEAVVTESVAALVGALQVRRYRTHVIIWTWTIRNRKLVNFGLLTFWLLTLPALH